MKTRMILSLGLSALVMGGTMVGCTATQGGLASAGSREAAVAAKLAARDAARASAALADNDPAQAVARAENAVSLMPQNASYRSLLGQSYLKAGRFASARTALTDALKLAPADGRIALNLALAQIATGDWNAARAMLDENGGTISATDRGLALALAGDPAGAVSMLTGVVRSGSATPKARQNLALALALGGQWQGARVVASADMSPADVDARIEEWAVFAKPATASDQVAKLLGVRAAPDPGQPIALALVAPVAIGPAEAHGSSPLRVSTTLSPAAVDVPLAVAEAAVAALPTPQAKAADVSLATRAFTPRPVATPVPLIRPEPRAMKVALTQAVLPAPKSGDWFVQVGAFSNVAIARDGWRHATRRMPALAARTPTNARYASKNGAVYRLAFGGFARAQADSICRSYRASGGACFVRAGAGDRVASWVAKRVQLASR
ncbi:SPOR domain-containing protein [Sphingomonas sp.]|jgi:Flp pilus assembly protein TadD|uniref:SPOR domain-containing protein n=1 Tax=Sphingomonas sp. TaxID=28214 RepID=UPI002ED94D0B